MTNFNALANSPQTAAQLLAASVAGNSTSLIVLGNPDSPPSNALTSLANLDAGLKLIAAASTQLLATNAGAGFTGGTGTIFKQSVVRAGNIVTTQILFDLTGLASSTTDLDIIGVGTDPAHMGQITVARNGTILGGEMKCLEVPAGGADDIDLYYATEATGVFDAGIGTLTEVSLITKGSAWTLNQAIGITEPSGIADKYLYLVGGEAGTAATYTAGKFLITLYGYV